MGPTPTWPSIKYDLPILATILNPLAGWPRLSCQKRTAEACHNFNWLRPAHFYGDTDNNLHSHLPPQ